MLNVYPSNERLAMARTLLYQRAVNLNHAGCKTCIERIDGSDYIASWAAYLATMGYRESVTEYKTSLELPSSAIQLLDRFSSLAMCHQSDPI